MLSRDNATLGSYLRLGPAAVLFIMAVLLTVSGPGPQRLEYSLYDWLQRTQAHPGSRQLVVVDTSGLRRPAGGLWHAPQLAELIRALDMAGARIILPTLEPPDDNGLPDANRLSALADLEALTRQVERQDTARGADAASLDNFARQLATIQEQALQQSHVVQAIAAAGNVIVAVRAVAPRMAAPSSTCGAAPNIAAAMLAASTPRNLSGGFSQPSPQLCNAAMAAGHAEFLPHEDGIVRETELLLRAGARTYPAVALAAARSGDGTRPGAAEPAAPLRILNRFYGGGAEQPAFDTFGADSVLNGQLGTGVLAGRMAVVGDRTDAGNSHATPVSSELPHVLMVATALSNLIENDYLQRPAWLSWGEAALCALIGVGLLAVGSALAPLMTLMIGVCVAAALLGIEAYLLLGPPRLWANFAGIAAFALTGSGILSLWKLCKPHQATLDPGKVGLESPVAGVLPTDRHAGDDEMAFSSLRQQSVTPAVKMRLYEMAVKHARRRELAKAETVLRYLVSVDPEFRGASHKLSKLTGIRSLPGTRAGNTGGQTAAAASETPAATPALPLRTLGRYVLEQVVGRGAMATVYLGCDPTINRKVAVKTIALAQEFSDHDLANARAQFMREAESAGRLNHPGIISIYDVGEDDGIAYLAMEYFPGRPLSYYTQQGRLLPPAQVLELMARAAEALHYAHNQRVVHRDIKPANLLYDEQHDVLKITDFGIARLTDTSRTKTGIILGTPSYMSPEQLAGLTVTGQSDLFSLGVTTYQLLAGLPPFRADSIPLLMQKIAHEAHEPLSRLRADLPAGADSVLERALTKHPAERFATGREMAMALRECCRTLAPEPFARSA